MKTRQRPPYFSAADYVFYLRRHVIMEKSKCDVEMEHDAIEVPSLSDLLRRVKDDLNYAFLNFQDEFLKHGGVSCLLDVLRICQGRQSGTEVQCRPQNLKKLLNDEYNCLLALKFSSCHKRSLDHLVEHATALSILACSIISNFSRTRIVALELLTRCCKGHPSGIKKVLEALSSVKLIFGESVRFKFLISMLNTAGKNSVTFERVTLTFVNTLLEKCCRSADRVRLQCELEEAGFDINSLEKKLHEYNVAPNDKLWGEIRKWKEMFLDVQLAMREYHIKSKENIRLMNEVDRLRDSLRRLEENNIYLIKTKDELKERCDYLSKELYNIKNGLQLGHTSDKGQKSSFTSSREEGSATDSGCFISDRDDKIPKALHLPEDNYQQQLEKQWLEWRYPSIPKLQKTKALRSRSTERSSTRAEKCSQRSKSENRKEVAVVTDSEDHDAEYRHCGGFFFKPNEKFPEHKVENLSTRELADTTDRSGTISGLVHREITRAVYEIGGWL